MARAPFKLRSGNASAFKNLGSSPVKQVKVSLGMGSEANANLEKKINKSKLPKNFNAKGSSASTTPEYKAKGKSFRGDAGMSKRVGSKSNPKISQKEVELKKQYGNKPIKKGTSSSMPKNFNVTGSSKAGKLAKVAKKVIGKAGKFLGGKTLGVAGMMMATSSKADQPTKGKGKREYEGGKIDFTKKE